MAYPIRRAARAVMLTPANEVLLMRMQFPWRKRDVWILPGGGIESGETAQQAMVREAFEETGAQNLHIVGEAWFGSAQMHDIKVQHEQQYFYVQTERFEAAPTKLSEAEMDWVREYKWWSLAALEKITDDVDPPGFYEYCASLVHNGLPATPIELEHVRN